MDTAFLRRGFNLSQKYVSKQLGISIPTLKKKEDGTLDYTKTEMLKLTELYKQHDSSLTVDKIFFAD